MKSPNGKRIVLSALCLLLAAVLLLTIAVCWNIIPASGAVAFVKYLTDGPILARIIIGAVLLMAAVGIFAAILKRSSAGKKEQNTDMNLLDKSDAGSAYISSAAIDSMVQRCAKGNKYVKSCVSTVRAAQSGGISVELKLIVLPECNIPAVCAALRQEIKKYVGSATGIAVTDVSCVVMGIAGGAPAANEKRVN